VEAVSTMTRKDTNGLEVLNIRTITVKSNVVQQPDSIIGKCDHQDRHTWMVLQGLWKCFVLLQESAQVSDIWRKWRRKV